MLDRVRSHISDATSTIAPEGKVTLYVRGEFLGNIHKIECREARISVGKYAQYESAVEVLYIGKGQRAPRQRVESYRPSLLVLEGWGHPDPDDAFEPRESSSPDVQVSQSRYMSCDDGWQNDFDAKINPYLASGSAKVVADFRGHNSNRPLANVG